MLLDSHFGVECLKVGSLKDGVENILLVDHHDSGLQGRAGGASEEFASPDLVESGLQNFGDRLLDDRGDVRRTGRRQGTFLHILHLRLAWCGSLPFSEYMSQLEQVMR
jgi:hypothetical protein